MVTLAVIILLMSFGVCFSVREYARPLYPTWLAVVVGTGVTLIGITIWLHTMLDTSTAWTAAGIVWAAFLITGGPMVVLQAIKEQSFADEAQRRDATTGRLDGDKTETNSTAP